MIRFDELHTVAPEIAQRIREKLTGTGICLLGTVRRDGSPRVTAVETSFHAGGAFIGAMPGSMKQIDLRRDPRFALITPLANRDDLSGEGKLFGRAELITDSAKAAEVIRAAADVAGFDAEAIMGSPMFELHITGAAWQYLDGEAWTTLSWTEEGGFRRRVREGATGSVVDVT